MARQSESNGCGPSQDDKQRCFVPVRENRRKEWFAAEHGPQRAEDATREQKARKRIAKSSVGEGSKHSQEGKAHPKPQHRAA